jgi:hypothetical protein
MPIYPQQREGSICTPEPVAVPASVFAATPNAEAMNHRQPERSVEPWGWRLMPDEVGSMGAVSDWSR